MKGNTVPDKFKSNALAYRDGFGDGVSGRAPAKRERFATAQAWTAYQGGYVEGVRERRAREKQAAASSSSATHPLFERGGAR